ncbi:MAG: GrpB family protein [Firmicutes bacterium]|nr:GrpB family protein [Bacillota bacterium]
MQIGLKRGTVVLCDYTDSYAAAIQAEAKKTMRILREILGTDAADIQHVGSTAIRGIKSKPIIDLMVGVYTFETIHQHDRALEEAGIIYRKQDVPGQLLYVVGEGDYRTHHIHVVIYGSEAWNNYINFRDYLNQRPEIASRYSALKQQLADQYPNDRGAYTEGKQKMIDEILEQAALWRKLGADLAITEFDADASGLIDPVVLLKDEPRIPKILISCFAFSSFERLKNSLENVTELGVLKNANYWTHYYKASWQGMEIGLVCAEVGAASCVGLFEDLFAMGAETLILYGNCGVLDRSIDDLAIILPTSAIRDEGTSFHYCPPSREIAVNTDYGDLFESMLRELGIPYHKGKCWTTDGFYRETAWKMQKRKEEGCICVDMEASAMAAVAKMRGKKILQFFYAADNLDTASWDVRSLSQLVRLEDKDSVGLIALEAARRIYLLSQSD